MAKDKKSFLIYCDIINTIDHLTNEEKGILFQHLLEYVNDMNPILEDRLLLTAWKPIEQQLKRDLKKYENTCNRNSKNGALGGRPKNPTKPKKPSGLNRNPTKPKKADTDKDKDIDNNIKDGNPHNLDFDKLINKFNEITGKKMRVITRDARDNINELLSNGYEKEDVINAIKNCNDDMWHKEHKSVVTLDYITSEKQFSKWASMGEKKELTLQELIRGVVR